MKYFKWALLGGVLIRMFAPRWQPAFEPPQQHPLRLPGRTVYAGDEEFLVREMGPVEGQPLLLVHGLAGSSLTEWYQVAPLLAENRRIVMIDHRGHGLSARADLRYEVSDVADDVSAVLDELGIGAVDVVGYSMGGVVAQSLAARNPGRVRRLVLMATFASHPELDRWLRRFGTLVARGWERISGIGTSEVRGGYLIATGAVASRHKRWLWRESLRREVESGAQASLALLRFDSREWVGKLGIETLVVIPSDDFLVPPGWQYELASLIPGARIAEIAGAGHELVWTHPKRVAEEVNGFLDS